MDRSSLTVLCTLCKLTAWKPLDHTCVGGETNLIFRFGNSRNGLIAHAAFISDIELGRRNPSEKVLADIARVLGAKLEDLQAMDVRAPIEEIKRLTQNDPRYALAFRTMIDKKVSAEELLQLANQKREVSRRSARNENFSFPIRSVCATASL